MKKSWQMSGLLAALLLATQGVGAAGLGKLSVRSALGQPLRAEIELLSVQPDEMAALNAQLANAEAFRQARISRTEAHKNLQFSIEQRANGTPYLRVSSNTPINDPFLDLLIELNWSSGRILRDYTVLLDPPSYERPQLEMAQALSTSAPSQSKAKPEETQVAEKTGKTPATKPKAERKTIDGNRYGPVKAGDTLRSIAGKTQHPDVTLEMMMASLYKANQQAFGDNNMNLLKKGQVLNVPDRDAVMMAFSPSQARKLVQEQAAQWREYRGQVADAATKSQEPSDSGTKAESGKITPAKPAQKPTEPVAAKDVVRLSKGEPGSAKPDEKMAQRIQTLEEELAARSRALQEAQDRVAQLERTVNDLQKLMALKAEQNGQATTEPGQEVPPEVAPTPEPVAEEKPKPKAPIPVPPPPAAEPSLVSTLMENPLYLGGALSALLLAVLGGYKVISGRRRKALAGFEQSVMTGGDQFKTAMFKTGGTAVLGAGDTTQGTMTELSRLGLGSIDTHEVDPIAEAEVYMAYGRDTQAEEILREALSKDPNRPEISLKLLEIYNARKDVGAFENQATSLYEQQGGKPTGIWQKAAEMGRKLDPANPLYVVDGADVATEMPVDVASAIVEAEPDVSGENIADFAPAIEESSPAPDDSPLEFNLGQPEPAQPEVVPAAAEEANDQNVIAFDLPEPSQPKVDKAASPEPDELDISELEMSFEATTETPQETEDTLELEMPLPAEEVPAQDEADFTLDFEPLEAVEAAPDDVALEEMATEVSLPETEVADELAFAPLEDIQMEVPVAEPEIQIEAIPEPAEMQEPNLDDLLSTDFPTEEIEAAPALPDLEDELEFGTSELEASPAESLDALGEIEAQAKPELDLPEFDLGGLELESELESEQKTPAAEQEAKPASAPELDFSGIDLDLADLPLEDEPVAQMAETEAAPGKIDPELWEEVNTKLDLSKAYLEMGDREGAREILQEVLAEGDADQKAEANKLIAESE